jgi:hypothetical protein
MQKTANEIKSEFELLASGHYQIHSFLYAQEFEQQAYENLIYPLMLVYPLGGNLSGTTYTRNYRVVIADRVLKSEGNELEVESDTQLIALDVLAYWMKLGTNERFSITSSNTITPFWEKWGDEVTGHFVDIGIEEFYDFNSCAIPLSSAIPSPTNPCKDARILINSVIYGNAPSDTNFNVVVKDQLGALVGSLIGGEWIVNTGGSCADASYTIEDSLGNVLYTGTIPSGGSATEVIGNSTLNVNNSVGTLISSRSILAEGTDFYNVGDSSAVLKDEDGNVLSTTPIKATETEDIVAPNGDVSVNSVAFDDVLSGGTLNIQVRKSTGNDLIGSKQGQYWRIGDSTAVIKDSANNTLKSEAIKATETENIVVNDSVAVIKNSVGTTLKSENILAEATENITINDSSLENSDASYSVDILAEGSLILPDSQINVNGVDSGDVVSVKTIDVNLQDSVGDPVTPTSVGLVGNILTIEVPSGGGSYDLDLVDRFGNAFPTKQVTANATWDLRTLTPFDFADIFLSELTAPSSTIQTAIIDLVDDLNAAGLWDKFHSIHPLVNGTANDHALNLKYPFRNRYSGEAYFQGSPTHDANGITTNGSNNGMVITTPPYLYASSSDCFSMSCYSRTNAGLGNTLNIDMGCQTNNSFAEYNQLLIKNSTNQQIAALGRTTNVYFNNGGFTSASTGLFTIVKNGTNGGISQNGVLLTGGTASAFNTANFVRIAAIGLGGAYNALSCLLTNFVARNYAYCATMKLFDMTQETDHYTAVQAFQTALSRNV